MQDAIIRKRRPLTGKQHRDSVRDVIQNSQGCRYTVTLIVFARARMVGALT